MKQKTPIPRCNSKKIDFFYRKSIPLKNAWVIILQKGAAEALFVGALYVCIIHTLWPVKSNFVKLQVVNKGDLTNKLMVISG